jgi:hypothetical protein
VGPTRATEDIRIHPAEILGDTAVQVGDGYGTVVLLAFAIVALILIGRLTSAKTKRLSPKDPAPWTGRYEMRLKAHANVGKGVQLPPPSPSLKDEKWRLKEAHSGSGWLFVVLVAAVLGALTYGQVDVSGLQQMISNPSGAANVSTPAPQPQPAPPRHVDNGGSAPSQHLRGHGHHGVRTHRPHN